MKKFVIMRGLPGCGKSTFIKENHLENYTVSSDSIRLLVASTNMGIDGSIGISQREDKWVWEKIYEILEIRFSHGLFTVFDATNIKTADLNRLYQLAIPYGYDVFCVDMSDIPVSVAKERNRMRETEKQVPDFVIEKMYNKLISSQIPRGIKVLHKDNTKELFYEMKNLSDYKKVNIIGDIHGCYDALMEMLNSEIKEDEYYIFCGDYVDRGIQNAEVMHFLFSIMEKENVCLLEGNHERHLRDFSNGKPIVSDVFRDCTQKELETNGIGMKRVRRFCSHLHEFLYFTYHGQKVFACHGGIPRVPENIDFLAGEQVIRGVGRYTDGLNVETNFANNHKDIILVHGHRNIAHSPVKVNENCYNLENSVEFGGTLRMVSFTSNGIETKEVVNHTFQAQTVSEDNDKVEELVKDLRENEYINEKTYGNISSFNFSRKAFQKGIWNKQTMTARGLFIDTKENKIVARSYNKFFRINETEETQMSNLKNKLVFPMDVYRKENGFLGIFSSYNGSPFFSTKSSIDGDFNGYFKEIMMSIYGEDVINKMNVFCNQNNCTLVFEVIDTMHDPHIVSYKESGVVLLDAVYNTISFQKLSYKKLVGISNDIGIPVKTKCATLNNYKEFEKFVSSVSDNKDYITPDIEGYVMEDANGFMTKLKTEYYAFWKYMRSITASVMKYGKYKKEDELDSNMAKAYLNWITEKKAEGYVYDSDKIIAIRNEFLKEKGDSLIHEIQ